MSQAHEKPLSDLEKLLAALPPRPAALDRDRLLFRAGQASIKRSFVWPIATLCMSAATGCLALVLVLQPVPLPLVRIVRVQVPVPTPAPELNVESAASDPQSFSPFNYGSEPMSPTMSYWPMQQQALRFGVESLPSTAAYGDEPSGRSPKNGPELSAGARPNLIEHPSLFPFGEP